MPADVRHAIRLFLRRPAFSAALVLTLGLGIGATTAVFSLVRAVLLRPLPYADPDRLVFAWGGVGGARGSEHPRHAILTGRDVTDWHRRSTSFESIAVIYTWDNNLDPMMDLVSAGTAERLRGAYVTANFFELVGVGAALGRTFDSRDAAGGPSVVVISDAFWRRRFGGDPAIVGRQIEVMEGRGAVRSRPTSHLVAGVLPPGFRFTYPEETEVWAILPWERIRPTNAILYQEVGRLRPGVTIAAAQAELTGILVDWRRSQGFPESRLQQMRALVEPVPEHVTAAVRPGLALLVGGAGIVLVIACVNVALLLLALIVDRRREISLRAALGASRGRVFRQMATEGSLVAAAGGLLGVALAWILLPALRAVVPAIVPRGHEMSVDPAVLAFALGVSVLTALVCALAPAWHAEHRDVQSGLRQSSAGATSDRLVTRWRRAIVLAQVAIVLALLVAASLLLHSFYRMRHVDLGFGADGIFTMEMRVLNPKYRDEASMAAFQRDVMDRVRALPDVAQASMTSAVPLRGVDFFYSLTTPSGESRGAHMRPVDREYFTVMRIPLLAGRTFTEADDAKAPTVAIVSESLGRILFGAASPIGRQLDLGDRVKPEIVGVVGDVRNAAVTKPGVQAFYLARTQQPNEIICLVIRPRPGARGLAAAVREAVRAVDPAQPVENPAMLDQVVADTTASERFFTVTTAGFAVVAVLLAIAGLAGVVSRTVTERAREMAIRIALGADSGQVVRMAVGHGMWPVAGGLAVGLLGAWIVSRALARYLFEVSPLDPLTYVGVPTLLSLAAAVACYLPARRASRVEPMVALKTE
jgi:putative ABC transport system permease protein